MCVVSLNVSIDLNHAFGIVDSVYTYTGVTMLVNLFNNKKPMKGKALRKHSLHEKTGASVLLKLFISGNE